VSGLLALDHDVIPGHAWILEGEREAVPGSSDGRPLHTAASPSTPRTQAPPDELDLVGAIEPGQAQWPRLVESLSELHNHEPPASSRSVHGGNEVLVSVAGARELGSLVPSHLVPLRTRGPRVSARRQFSQRK
jgi:hypothetical protein